MITAQHISKTYGKGDTAFQALHDVSFSITSGQTASIIGKSGSGKSTLLHLLSGLDRPTSGTITIDGTNIFTMPAKDIDDFRARTMSFVFQSFFVEASQTCYQNVMLPLEIARAPLTQRKKLVREALSAVDLADKINEQAGNLSGGQKQRLAIARAIVNKPKILFADEPTGNLDSATGDLIIQLLFDMNRTMGSTVVLVTHDQELAGRCDVQITLKDGSIQTSNQVKHSKVKQ